MAMAAGGGGFFFFFFFFTGSVAVLLMNLLLIPHLGITGAAIAWAATIVLDSALAFSQVRWGMGIAGSLRSIGIAAGLAVACFGVMPLLARLVFGRSVVTIVVGVLVAAAIFAVPVWRRRDELGLDLFAGALRPGSAR